MSATSTGVMAKAVLLAIGAADYEADAIMAGEFRYRAVPDSPEQVLVELSDELIRYRRQLPPYKRP